MERPCGVVLDVKELFGSESKAQVYAHIHDLLSKPAFAMTSKCIEIHLYIFTCIFSKQLQCYAKSL